MLKNFIFIIVAICASVISHASKKNVTTTELRNHISSSIENVEEFRAIKEKADELGVKVYLFGGTAAAFAHYAKWDLLQKKGDSRYQPDRFDFDYTNIFRSTQDADLVVDGSNTSIAELQKYIENRYKYFMGSKSQWELRPLKNSMGPKGPLLNDFDFLNQHTDSHSTGLIEITTSKKKSDRVKDLRDWKNSNSQFLKDVASAKLHYYWSEKHNETSRAQRGMNPPILSVVRYLTKAFQYELEMRPEDLKIIKAVIKKFNPHKDLKNKYVSSWFEEKGNGKKLILHAVNIEYAWNTLEKIGLRKILVDYADKDIEDSLSWWLNREPLRVNPVGQGNGATAKSLGISLIAHETNSFLSYESITRAHTGDPNVLISRSGSAGEMAAKGNGFYTAVGREGMRGTGLTVRFNLDPKARKGTDFEVYGDIVLILNKAVIKVIPESLNIGIEEYLDMVANGEALDKSDKGMQQKLLMRISNKVLALSEVELIAKLNSMDAKKKSIFVESMLPEIIKKSPSIFRPLILGVESTNLSSLKGAGALDIFDNDNNFRDSLFEEAKKRGELFKLSKALLAVGDIRIDLYVASKIVPEIYKINKTKSYALVKDIVLGASRHEYHTEIKRTLSATIKALPKNDIDSSDKLKSNLSELYEAIKEKNYKINDTRKLTVLVYGYKYFDKDIRDKLLIENFKTAMGWYSTYVYKRNAPAFDVELRDYLDIISEEKISHSTFEVLMAILSEHSAYGHVVVSHKLMSQLNDKQQLELIKVIIEGEVSSINWHLKDHGREEYPKQLYLEGKLWAGEETFVLSENKYSQKNYKQLNYIEGYIRSRLAIVDYALENFSTLRRSTVLKLLDEVLSSDDGAPDMSSYVVDKIFRLGLESDKRIVAYLDVLTNKYPQSLYGIYEILSHRVLGNSSDNLVYKDFSARNNSDLSSFWNKAYTYNEILKSEKKVRDYRVSNSEVFVAYEYMGHGRTKREFLENADLINAFQADNKIDMVFLKRALIESFKKAYDHQANSFYVPLLVNIVSQVAKDSRLSQTKEFAELLLYTVSQAVKLMKADGQNKKSTGLRATLTQEVRSYDPVFNQLQEIIGSIEVDKNKYIQELVVGLNGEKVSNLWPLRSKLNKVFEKKARIFDFSPYSQYSQKFYLEKDSFLEKLIVGIEKHGTYEVWISELDGQEHKDKAAGTKSPISCAASLSKAS